MVTVGYRNPFACVKKAPHGGESYLAKNGCFKPWYTRAREEVTQGGGTTLQGSVSGTNKLVTQSVISAFRKAVFGMQYRVGTTELNLSL